MTKPIPMKHAALKPSLARASRAAVTEREAVKERGRAAAQKRKRLQAARRREAALSLHQH